MASSFIASLLRKKSIETILANAEEKKMPRHLTAKDLTGLGIAAIIGAGIFSTIGKASAHAGPGVILLFLFTAIACAFAAFAYAEFASIIPVSGSAYTYAYVAFGEFVAWIIGWALIMEYTVGNIVVAISWSDYFTSLINTIPNVHFPEWLSMDYFSAKNGFQFISEKLQNGTTLVVLQKEFPTQISQYTAWETAPDLGFIKAVFDAPALCINILITWLVYRGIKESRNASNIMVFIKICIVLIVIIAGAFYVDVSNWKPFLPNGISGALSGISAVFFAYIGFDAISTTAEECKDPKRDLPRGIFYSIIICTILYIALALVLTGMVSYKLLDVGDPLAFVFSQIPSLKWLSNVIALSAVIAMASVLLVFQLGQPRIWMSMSRDGLLPNVFSKIHPKFSTPSFSTIMTGVAVGLPIFFVDMSFVTDICSIGTLFAFVLVCGGVLALEQKGIKGTFKTPYVNAKYILPIILISGFIIGYIYYPTDVKNFIFNTPKLVSEENFNEQITPELKNILGEKSYDLFKTLPLKEQEEILKTNTLDFKKFYISGFTLFTEKIPLWIFFIVSTVLCFFSYKKNFSLIPTLGLLTCLYMMAELGWKNWLGFTIWLFIGLLIYFFYSKKNSILKQH